MVLACYYVKLIDQLGGEGECQSVFLIGSGKDVLNSKTHIEEKKRRNLRCTGSELQKPRLLNVRISRSSTFVDRRASVVVTLTIVAEDTKQQSSTHSIQRECEATDTGHVKPSRRFLVEEATVRYTILMRQYLRAG